MTIPQTAPLPKPPLGAPSRPTHVVSALWFALRILLPIAAHRPSTAHSSVAHAAAAWITPLGLLIGLAWAGVFKATWRLYGEIGNVRIVPALSVVLLDGLLVGTVLILGLTRTIHRLSLRVNRRSSAEPSEPLSQVNSVAPLSPVATLALVFTVVSLFVFVTSIPTASTWWPGPQDWRYPFRHFYPAPIYRPLILAPVWGRWAMLLAATIGRTAPYADAATVMLCQSLRPGRVLRFAILPLVLTSIYLSRDGNYLIGVIVGVALFGVVYLFCAAMARLGGGQTRDSLGAAGAWGQLTFLALYRAFWPIIHP